MAGGFLGKLLGRSKPVSPDVAEALRELDALGQTRPALSEVTSFLRAVLPTLADEVEELPPLPAEKASAKRRGGIPLLRGESWPVDVGAFRGRWFALCSALRQPSRSELAEALRSGRLVPEELAQDLLAGHVEGIHARADALGLDAGCVGLVLRLTMLPVLSRFHAAHAARMNDVPWDHGYCPTCGSWPLLAELRGLEQTRVLRCGLCCAGWEVPRLFCPFCGTRDHQPLGFLHVEGEEASYRAATCDACRGYVKTAATLAPLPAPRLLVTDLATLHLDLAAAERGYLRPGYS